MKTGKLLRLTDDGIETTGAFAIRDESGKVIFSCSSLERPWKQNQRGISCIPAGIYDVVFSHMATKNVDRYLIENVPGRDAIFIHSGNFVDEVHGCILLGRKISDINKDGVNDIASSKDALTEFESLLNKESWQLEISNLYLNQSISV